MDSTTYWNEVYARYAPLMRGVCLRYVSDFSTAEDIVQEGFLTAMAKYDSYKGHGSFEGWLRRIMINQALMFLRKQKRSPTEMMEPETAARVAAEEPQDIPRTRRSVIEQAAFTKTELMAMLSQLPEHHRAVFNLHVIDGLKHKEIAELLDITQNTSKSHLLRARKKLNEVLYAEAEQREKKDRRRVGFWWFILPGSATPDRIFSSLRSWVPPGTPASPAPSPFTDLPTHVLSAKSILAKQIVAWSPWITTGLVATTALVWTAASLSRPQEPTRSQLPLVDSVAATLMTDTTLTLLETPQDSLTFVDRDPATVAETPSTDAASSPPGGMQDTTQEDVVVRHVTVVREPLVVRDQDTTQQDQ
ncbi:MAG: sigma-70 family RNA polymerase sigma factor [Bacteroidota bacterium]